jgi:hypothetical protein
LPSAAVYLPCAYADAGRTSKKTRRKRKTWESLSAIRDPVRRADGG